MRGTYKVKFGYDSEGNTILVAAPRKPRRAPGIWLLRVPRKSDLLRLMSYRPDIIEVVSTRILQMERQNPEESWGDVVLSPEEQAAIDDALQVEEPQ